MIEKKLKTLTAQQQKLQDEATQLKRSAQPSPISEDFESQLLTLARDVKRGVEKFTPGDKRRVLEKIDARVDVLDPKHIRVSARLKGGPFVDTSCWSAP